MALKNTSSNYRGIDRGIEAQSRPRYQVAGMRWKKMTWKNTNSNYRGIDRGIYEDLFTPRYQGGVILKNN